MKNLLSAALLLLLPLGASAQSLSHATNLWCQLGGQKVSLQGLLSTTEVQRSIPSCTVHVYDAGTTNDASIFSDNLSTPTPKANPFTALSNGTIDFYAAAACYDIVTSGGSGSDTFPAPYTYTSLCLGGSGGSGSGSVTSVGFSAPTGFQISGSPVTGVGTLALSMPSGWTSQDLLIGNGANSITRLPIGANSTCLTVTAGALAYGAFPCVGVPAGTTNYLLKYSNGSASLVGNSSLLDDGINPVQSPNGLSVMTNAAWRAMTNASSATTVLNQLVERNSSGFAVNASVSSTRALGIAGQGAGVNSGAVQVAFSGYAPCVFDGTTTINDYAVPSTTTAGLCHDAGASRPLNAEVIGTVTTVNSGPATTAIVDFFTGDTSQTTPSAVTPCGSSPGPLAYYTAASTLGCDTASTDGAGNLSLTSITAGGSSAGYLFFTASSQPTFGVANSAYLFAPSSIPTTYALKLPSALGTAGQALSISGVTGGVATLTWSSAAGCPEGTCIQNAPLADQTITGSHQLINDGTTQSGTALGSFDSHIQDWLSNYGAGEYPGVSGQMLGLVTNIGVQGLAQGDNAVGVAGVASNTTAASGAAHSSLGGDYLAYLTSTANTASGSLGGQYLAGNYPTTGTTAAFSYGVTALGGNFDLGTTTLVASFESLVNSSPTGAVTKFFAFDTEQAMSTGGTTTAVLHATDQGAGANNYGIYFEGSTHNKLGSGLTTMGSTQITGITGSVQCLHVDTTGLVSGTSGDCATGGSGTVTSIATTSPITGGTITTTGTIACATCVVASSPGLGLAHFAGSTQTVTSSLVVNADITNSTIDLTTKVTGILPSANGGTANGFFTVSGPASSAKTFTFPNASATVLTSNAAVTVAQGGTGLTSGTSGGIPAYTGSTTITSSGVLAQNQLVLGGGAGATPATLGSLGTTTTVLHGNAAGAPSFGSVVSADLNITTTTCTNQFLTAISATGTGTCTTDTLASAQHANQGTTTTVLHGNASGNPSFGAVVGADMTNNTVTATQLASQYSIIRCYPGLGDGLNAIPAGTYLQTNCYNNSGVTWTITRIGCFTDNAGSSTLAATNGAGTALLTGAVTCNTSAGGNAGTQSATTTIANGDVIKFTFVADGTSKQSGWFVSLTQ